MTTTGASLEQSGPDGESIAGIDDEIERSLQRLERIANTLDNIYTIPKINVGVGLDPVIGLIPGFGDTLAMVISSYVILKGVLLGAPSGALGRMTAVLVVEWMIGSIPVIGDVIDFFWGVNVQNVSYLRENQAELTGQTNWAFLVFGFVLPIIAVLVITGAVLLMLLAVVVGLAI